MTPLDPHTAVPATDGLAPNPQRSNIMEPIILLVFLVGWIALQVWVLPKLGVRT